MSEIEFIPKIAMSIQAHPDDQEFTVAGTLAKWAKAGCEIVSVIITSGDGGSNDPAHDIHYKPTLAKIREGEQSAANDTLGIKKTIYMHYPDGELEPTVALRKEVTKLIRTHKPEVVVTGDPQGVFYGNGYINHPDHRAAALAAVDAIFPAAGQPTLFKELEAEGLYAHKPYKVYVQAWEKAETFVNITETIDLKIEALRKHVSQMNGWDPAERIREWSAATAKGKEMEYAEGYRVITFEDAAPKPPAEAEKQTEPAAASA